MPEWMTTREPSVFYEVDTRAAEGVVRTGDQARDVANAARGTVHAGASPGGKSRTCLCVVVDASGHKLSTSDIACPVAGAAMLSSPADGMLMLGLRLQPRSEPVDALIIDRVEPPLPNSPAQPV